MVTDMYVVRSCDSQCRHSLKMIFNLRTTSHEKNVIFDIGTCLINILA